MIVRLSIHHKHEAIARRFRLPRAAARHTGAARPARAESPANAWVRDWTAYRAPLRGRPASRKGLTLSSARARHAKWLGDGEVGRVADRAPRPVLHHHR